LYKIFNILNWFEREYEIPKHLLRKDERRLKMAKKRSDKKEKEGEHCEGHHCTCCHISMKIAIIACLLFLMTVWKGLGAALLKVHWGIYLAITILLLILPMFCKCRRK
jgi:hypothetical protein